MVKFKHLAKFDVDFSGFNYVSVNDAGTKAIYTKEGSDLKFVVKGSELVGDGSYLTDGVINQMIVLNSKGIKAFTTSSNLQLDAETVDGYIDTHSLGALIRDTAGNGNDRVIGSNKGEFLLAGGGNDTMTGGRGSDYFQFHSVYDAGIEHDVITDFQVRGKNRDFARPTPTPIR
jgi:Ca2+-binding RTX toxin-like protein